MAEEPEDNKAKLEKLTGLDLSKADDVTLFIVSELQEVRRSVEELTESVRRYENWLYSIDEVLGLHAVWVAQLFDKYLPAGPTERDPRLPPLGEPRTGKAMDLPRIGKDGVLTWRIGEPTYPRVLYEEERKKMEPEKPKRRR